jgi:hypothetical protein
MITRQRNLVLNEIAVELAATQEYDQAITLLNKVIEEEVRHVPGTRKVDC